MNSPSSRFFILGCQRTGTTLTRLILEAHPEVFCYDEVKGYAVLQKPLVEDVPTARLIGFKLPRWTEQFTQKVLFDEGPEGPCDNFYQGEKILFLHRDVRDTISSMLNLKMGASNWCETCVPRIVDGRLAHDPEFRSRYRSEWAVIENCNNRLIGLATLYWKYKTESFFLYREAGFPVMPVSYERLVTDPRPTLEAACAHLGILFHEDLLRHHELPHTEVFENGLTVGNTDPLKPIRFDSVGQWSKFLSNEDLELIDRIAGDLPARISARAESSRRASAGHS